MSCHDNDYNIGRCSHNSSQKRGAQQMVYHYRMLATQISTFVMTQG